MYSKLLIFGLSLVLQCASISGQRQWVLPTTTAAEMRNPYTWYWPYAIAAAEGYREWYQNAQQITNQLYLQAYNTNAFWWTQWRPSGSGGTGGTGGTSNIPGGTGNVPGGTGNVPGGTGNVPGGTGNIPGQGGNTQFAAGMNNQNGRVPVGNMAQGGTGWNY